MNFQFEYKVILTMFCVSFLGLLIGINNNLFEINYLTIFVLFFSILSTILSLLLIKDYYSNKILIIKVIRKRKK